MMKKAVIYLFLFTISLSASSKTLDDILSEFSKAPHAENVNLGKFVFSMMKMLIPNDKDFGFTKKISSMSVLDLESCSTDIKLRFAEQIENLEIDGYEILMKVKDNDDNVLIMSKSKKDRIKEFVIISVNDPAIIKLKGDFDLNDLPGVNEKYGEKKKD